MKRLHVHVAVHDLQQSIRFYSALFAAQPAVKKDDYAKWMLDDPRVNFAISTRGDQSRPRPSRHPGRERRGARGHRHAPRAGRRRRPPRRRARPAATPRATSTGPSIRRASPGNRSTRWTRCRCTARTRARAPRKSRAPARPPAARLMQRPVPVHGQLGEVDPRRGLSELCRAEGASRPTAPAAIRRARSIRSRSSCWRKTACRHSRSALEELGRVRPARRAAARLRVHGLRQRRGRGLPGVAGPADHRALGHRGSRGGHRQRRGQAQGIPARLQRAQHAHQSAARAADRQARPADAQAQAGRDRQGAAPKRRHDEGGARRG